MQCDCEIGFPNTLEQDKDGDEDDDKELKLQSSTTKIYLTFKSCMAVFLNKKNYINISRRASEFNIDFSKIVFVLQVGMLS